MNARELLDLPGPPSDLHPTRSAAANWPPELDGEWVNAVLDEDERLEAEYLAARAERLAPVARALQLRPEYVAAREREKLREDAAAIRAVRWLLAAGLADGWQKAYQRFVLKGHFDWVPASTLHWYRERWKD